jgi:HSP20 family protein
MTVIKKRENGGLIPSLRSNLNELFDMDRFLDEPFFETPFWNNRKFNRVPAANIKETKKEFIVEIAAPGMHKKDFHIDIENNMLEIKVEKEIEKEEKDVDFTRREYDYTAFYRAFDLPEHVIEDKIKAEYIDGILKVHLPKSMETKKKKAKEIAVL